VSEWVGVVMRALSTQESLYWGLQVEGAKAEFTQ
jgi:hypothetical protein